MRLGVQAPVPSRKKKKQKEKKGSGPSSRANPIIE
jgi:hypothetical protein